MASCPSNLYCVAGDEDEETGSHTNALMGRSQTAKGVLYTTYRDEAKATLVKTQGRTYTCISFIIS